MHRLSLFLTTLVLVVAGCGSDDDGGADDSSAGGQSNANKIATAQQSEASADEIHTKLDNALDLHHYAGVDDVFNLPGGGRCTIDGVYAGSEADVYRDEENALQSPDGGIVVEVGTFQGTSTGDCLVAVNDTLGW
jgi:hypothetical protein